jgi:hypothetical protein
VDIPDDLHGGASCWLCSHLGLRQSSDYPAIVACQGGIAGRVAANLKAKTEPA